VKPPRLRRGWGGGCGPCPVLASSYTLAFDLQLRKKITEKTQSRHPKSARLISAERLDWPTGPRRSWLSRGVTGLLAGPPLNAGRICRTTCSRAFALSQFSFRKRLVHENVLSFSFSRKHDKALAVRPVNSQALTSAAGLTPEASQVAYYQALLLPVILFSCRLSPYSF
jgi:hypothetical protein